MSPFRRYARQMLLADIGERGQERLAAAIAPVSGPSLAHEIASSYATRAGVGSVVAGAIDETRLAPAFLEHAAPRAMVAGSRAALAVMRAAIFVGRPSHRSS